MQANMMANLMASRGIEVTEDIQNVLNLGMTAAENQQRQRQEAASRVSFNDQA